MEKEKISVIIPTFNEANNILKTLNETKRVLSKLDYNYEIIVVDDGSKDETVEIIQEKFNPELDRIYIKNYLPNAGKGNAIKFGYQFAEGDFILFMDADLDLHPKQIVKFLNIMDKNEADAVIGSKKSKDSKVNYTLKRRILSNGYYYFIKLLFGLPLRDTQTGFKLFRMNALKVCMPKVSVKKYAFDLELLIILHKNGFKIVECPVEVNQVRKFGGIGIKDILQVFKDTIIIFFRLYFKRIYY
jgi:glycosyltransferase involved in cell wall biosynthesis